MGNWFSQSVNCFHGRGLPEPAVPAGYAALIERFDLAVPLPPWLSAIAERHHPAPNPSWHLLTPRHRPPDTLEGQLVFALKWEGVDLGVLAALFKAVEPNEIAAIARATPTGAFARRTWFLYEWLTGRELDVPESGAFRSASVRSVLLRFSRSPLQFALLRFAPLPCNVSHSVSPLRHGVTPKAARPPTPRSKATPCTIERLIRLTRSVT